MTRMTTRMLYVEEMGVTDTETENVSKSYKSFEMETKVHSKGDNFSESTISDIQEETDTEKVENNFANGEIQSEASSKSTKIKPPKLNSLLKGMNATVAPETVDPNNAKLSVSAKTTKVLQNDETKTIDVSLLYKKMKPLFICMKASGIFFIRRKKSASHCLVGVIQNCTPLQAFCLLVISILLINFLRSLAAFNSIKFDADLFFKFLNSIFFYESVTRAILAYWHCYRQKKGLPELFMTMEKVCYPDHIIPYEQSLLRVMKTFIFITFVVSFGNVAATAYGLFGPGDVQDMFDAYLVPFTMSTPGIEVFKICLLLITFLNAQVAILSLSFYAVVCYVLYKEFEYLCRSFSMKIREDGQFTDEIGRFRIWHQKRCKLVEDADKLFKYYIANTYLTNVPLLCLLLYSMVNTESDVSLLFINVFRLAYVLFQMLVVSVAATMINDQVNMLLNKLTGTSIGLTAWDMFVINKPTVLTVVGMILTYFFLLLQFKNPIQSEAVCKCLFQMANGSSINIPITTQP